MGPERRIWGYRWRSSKVFITGCIATALFTETFLFGFLIPILKPMLEDRLQIDPIHTQSFTSALLAVHGLVSVVSGLLLGYFADNFFSKRTGFVLSLVLTFIGTLLLAICPNVPSLFIGRVLQAASGSAAWIIGLATLADTFQAENMGKTIGVVTSCVSAGMLSGPTVAGFLLEKTGYWTTWSSVLGILALDIFMRLVMIERRKEIDLKSDNATDEASDSSDSSTYQDEESALLSGEGQRSYTSLATKPPAPNNSAFFFYNVILSQPRVIVALITYLLHSSLIASLDATVPIHVKRAFGWGSFPAGLLFLGLQVPSLFLSPLCGWLRDKIGTRYPTTLGLLLMSPLLWLLGAASEHTFPWGRSIALSRGIYVLAMIGVGCAGNLLKSVGPVELNCVVDELEKREPNVFGPRGGRSRTFSLSNVSYNGGLLVGPLVSGFLTNAIGYYYMNVTLAVVCLVMSTQTWTFLPHKRSRTT